MTFATDAHGLRDPEGPKQSRVKGARMEVSQSQSSDYTPEHSTKSNIADHKSKSTDQRDRVEDLQVNPHSHNLVFIIWVENFVHGI